MKRSKWLWATLLALPLAVAGAVYATTQASATSTTEGFTCPITGEQLPCPNCCPLQQESAPCSPSDDCPPCPFCP
jgi:hypothetical protein